MLEIGRWRQVQRAWSSFHAKRPTSGRPFDLPNVQRLLTKRSVATGREFTTGRAVCQLIEWTGGQAVIPDSLAIMPGDYEFSVKQVWILCENQRSGAISTDGGAAG
jgi:hypothetical protein